MQSRISQGMRRAFRGRHCTCQCGCKILCKKGSEYKPNRLCIRCQIDIHKGEKRNCVNCARFLKREEIDDPGILANLDEHDVGVCYEGGFSQIGPNASIRDRTMEDCNRWLRIEEEE